MEAPSGLHDLPSLASLANEQLFCRSCKKTKSSIQFEYTTGSRGREPRRFKQCVPCRAKDRNSYQPHRSSYNPTSLESISISTFLETLNYTLQSALQAETQDHRVEFHVHLTDQMNTNYIIDELMNVDGYFWLASQARELVHGGKTLEYRCAERERSSESTIRRSNPRTSHACSGYVKLTYINNQMFLKYAHSVSESHLPFEYKRNSMTEEVSANIAVFVDQGLNASSVIARLQEQANAGSLSLEGISRAMIRTQVSELSRSIYQRDRDPLQSATILVYELDRFRRLNVEVHGINFCLAFITTFCDSIALDRCNEAFVDDSRGTESSNLRLYSLMVPFKGKAFPISYCFVGSGAQGDLTKTLASWFASVRESHPQFNPAVIFTDKDKAQIKAIEQVFGEDAPRYCLWHLKQAVDRVVKSSVLYTESINDNIFSTPALTAIHSDFDAGWIRRGTDVRLPEEERKRLKTIIANHSFKIPRLLRKSDFEVHDECLVEIYNFTYQMHKPALFRYLYKNWYQINIFRRWSLIGQVSIREDYIPLSQTTMFVESHWNSIKTHDLPKYRPRLDLTLAILHNRTMVRLQEDLKRLVEMTEYPSWWIEFSKEWKKLEATLSTANEEQCQNYQTDLMSWTCRCVRFCSRFLLCKHLVYSVNQTSIRAKDVNWRNVERRPLPPYVSITGIHLPYAAQIRERVNEESAAQLQQQQQNEAPISRVRARTISDHASQLTVSRADALLLAQEELRCFRMDVLSIPNLEDAELEQLVGIYNEFRRTRLSRYHRELQHDRRRRNRRSFYQNPDNYTYLGAR